MKLKLKKVLAVVAMILFFGGAVNAQKLERGIELHDASYYEMAKYFLLDEIQSNPTAEAYYYLGDTYLMLNQADSAAFYFEKSKLADPLYTLAQVGLDKINLKDKKDVAGVGQRFTAMIKKEKKNADVLSAIADAYASNNMITEAAPFFEASYKANKRNPKTYILEGDMLFKEKKHNEALGKYEQAQYFDPNSKLALLKLANAYIGMNRTLSIENLYKIISIDPNYIPVHMALADIFYNDRDFEAAIGEYETYVDLKGVSNTDVQNYAASLYFSKNNDKSLEVADKVLAEDPSHFVMRRLKMYNYFDKGEKDKALEQAEEFFTNKKDNDKYIFLDYNVYGTLLEENKEYAKAAEIFSEAIKMDTTQVQIYKNLATIYSNLGDMTKMEENIKEYVAKGTPLTSEYYSFGRTYYQNAGNAIAAQDTVTYRRYLTEACNMFDNVIKDSPESYLGFIFKARALASLDIETTEGLAKPLYEQTIEKLLAMPEKRVNELFEAYRYMANYHYLRDEKQEAIDYCKKILEIKPNEQVFKDLIISLGGKL